MDDMKHEGGCCDGGNCEGGSCCSDGGSCGCHDGSYCGCMHHKMVPGAILLIALLFLLKALGVVGAGTVDLAWPILLGLAALMKLMSGKCKCYGGMKK
jgi:hypothetical protein